MASPHERLLTLQVKMQILTQEPGASPPSSSTLLGFLMRFIHLSHCHRRGDTEWFPVTGSWNFLLFIGGTQRHIHIQSSQKEA